MNGLLAYLTENCCRGNPAACGLSRVTLRPFRKEPSAMKRLHVHISVDDLAQSIGFYSTVSAAQPVITKPDYAKWMLEDPRVNFAISARGGAAGLDHLGIQVETPDELQEVYQRLQQADGPVLEEGMTTRCYAQSEKSWITDPQGVSWESFLTSGESTVYGNSADLGPIRTVTAACCTSETTQGVCCAPNSDLAADAPCCAAKPEQV
jgi:catechol-2,3-dioxygenase